MIQLPKVLMPDTDADVPMLQPHVIEYKPLLWIAAGTMTEPRSDVTASLVEYLRGA